MGICHSQKNTQTVKSQVATPMTASGKVSYHFLAPQLFNAQVTQLTKPSQQRLKSYSQNLTVKAISKKTDWEVPTPSSIHKSPLIIHSERSNAFELQKQFFKKYSTIQFKGTAILSMKETESTLFCQHNLTAQLVKVTILDMLFENHIEFFKEIKQFNLNCINICQYLECFKEKDQIYLVQEHGKGGSLSSLISKQPLDYDKAASIITQIIKAVNHLHCLNLSHGSLTIDSFIISDSSHPLVKLQDLNPVFNYQMEVVQDKERNNHIALYQSPEKEKSAKNDVWAIGIIFYQLLTGCFPEQPLKKEDSPLIWNFTEKLSNIPSNALTALKSMLEFIPQQRSSLKTLIEKDYFKIGINQEILQQIIINLANTKKITQFQSAVLFYMMNKFQSEEVQILTKLFDDADQDCDGVLNKSELIALYKLLIQDDEDFISTQIETIFSCIDVDNSGGISINEFITAASNKRELLTDDNLEGCFKILSTSQGGITAKSIARKIKINEAVIKKEIQEYVYDQVDLISFKEIMKSI